MKTKNLFLILGIIFLFVSLTGAKDFNIFNSSLTSQSYFLVNGTTGLVYANGQLVGSGTLNSTGWNSTGAKVFLANTSAYVGIGTTSPTSILHLKGTNPTLNIEASGTTDNPGIVLARTSIAGNIGSKIWLDNTNGNLYIDNWYDATNGNIYLRTRTYGTPVNAMTILGSGNVGIGTTTPGNNLSVQQLAGTGGPSLAAVNWKSPSYNLGYLGAENGSYNSGAIYIYKDGASNTVLSGNGNSYLMGGKVGIGKTAPSYTLDVVGDVNAYRLLINGTAVGTGSITGTGTAWYIPMWNGTTSLNNSAVTQNGSNVGIGTTSLNSKFTIYGTAGDWGSNLQMFDNTGVYNSRISVASDGLLFRNFYANSTNDAIAYSFRNSNDGKLVTIKGGGNVGIGTTAPTQKLDVIGNVNVTGDVYPSTAYTRNLGLSGNRWGAFYTYNADISNLLTVGGNTNIGNGDFFVNVTSERVGIGTTAPGQIVSINGVSNSITPVIEYQVDGSTKGYIGAAASTGGIINGAVSGDLVLRSQGQKIMFSTDSGTTAQMMINGSGYVGIGTTSSFLGKLTVIQSGGNEGIYVNSSGTGAVGVYGIGGASVSSTGITGTSGGVGVRGFG